jgi:hypothetical protein
MIENIWKVQRISYAHWDGNTYRGGYSDHFPTYIIVLKKSKHA